MKIKILTLSVHVLKSPSIVEENSVIPMVFRLYGSSECDVHVWSSLSIGFNAFVNIYPFVKFNFLLKNTSFLYTCVIGSELPSIIFTRLADPVGF